MYIIEILAKTLFKRKKESIPDKEEFYQEIEEELEENIEDCDHVYLAIDSTQDYFACNKCGHVIKNENKHAENINIFKV